MENQKKERKFDAEDDDLEEEMKMEKFYSLLRSFREARDRRRKELQESEKSESNNKKMKITVPNSKPKPETSFQREDFSTEIHFRKPPLIFPTPISSDTDKKDKQIEQRHNHALDLRLAL